MVHPKGYQLIFCQADLDINITISAGYNRFAC